MLFFIFGHILRTMIYRIFIIGLLIVMGQKVYSQSRQQSQYFYIEPKVHIGKPILYSDSLSQSINNPYQAYDIRVGMYPQRKHPQNYYFHMPTWGIGLYHAQFKSDTIGNPFALYAYYNAPFVRKEKLSFGWELGLGLGWRFNEYNPVNNPKNDLIGSDKNAFANGSINLAYMITPRTEIVTGFHFSHFSNGAINMPNKGFNMWGGDFALRYHIPYSSETKGQFRPLIPQPEKIRKGHEWLITHGSGIKTTIHHLIDEPMYYAASFSLDYLYQYHWVGKFGGGIDYLYDASLEEKYPGEKDFSMIGMHVSHEVDAGVIAMLFQVGTYAWKKVPAKGFMYMRLGIKKDIGKRLYATFSLKTLDGFRADYFELGMGYRFILREK